MTKYCKEHEYSISTCDMGKTRKCKGCGSEMRGMPSFGGPNYCLQCQKDNPNMCAICGVEVK